MSAVILFTQIFPRLYILTLIAAATLSFLFLWLYSKKGATYSNTSNDKEIISKKLAFKLLTIDRWFYYRNNIFLSVESYYG